MDNAKPIIDDLAKFEHRSILELAIQEGEASDSFIDATPQYFESRKARLQVEYHRLKDNC